MSCQQQAQLAAVVSAVLMVANIMALVSFYGWRRAQAPWRSVFFTLFVVCTLLVLDFFIFAIVPAPPPRTSVHACR